MCWDNAYIEPGIIKIMTIRSLSSFLMMTAFFCAVALGAPAMAEEHKAEGEAEAGSSVHFVELNPLILPIINDHGAAQMVSIVVSVEVDSQEKADQVTKYSPRLTDAFLSDLYGSFSNLAKANGGIVPIPVLKQRLNALSNKVLGDHVVDDVLLQVLQKRST